MSISLEEHFDLRKVVTWVETHPLTIDHKHWKVERRTGLTIEPRKNNYFPLCWLVNGDHYNGLSWVFNNHSITPPPHTKLGSIIPKYPKQLLGFFHSSSDVVLRFFQGFKSWRLQSKKWRRRWDGLVRKLEFNFDVPLELGINDSDPWAISCF